MSKQIPKTKEETFAQLDAMLSDEDKTIVARTDAVSFHFTLGILIRNIWINQQNKADVRQLAQNFGLDPEFFHSDDLSSAIIKAYQEHLLAQKS